MTLSLKTPNHQLVVVNINLEVCYILMHKRDLLLVQIGNKNPDLIFISEILPKAPNSIIHSALFAIPGHSLYLNFDPDFVFNVRGVSLFISQNIHALQVSFRLY